MTHPVGQLKPNGCGLYDMSGNVGEWCADRYVSDYYKHSPTNDPIGSATGNRHVIRGNSWRAESRHCRLATRSGSSSAIDRKGGLGFRLAMPIDVPKLKTSQTPEQQAFIDAVAKL